MDPTMTADTVDTAPLQPAQRGAWPASIPLATHSPAGEVERLRARVDGLLLDVIQKDSAQMRALCQARDDARAECARLREQLAQLEGATTQPVAGSRAGSTLKQMVRLPKDPAQCWEWLGAVDSLGAACKEFNGRQMVARRWMWAQLFGAIPDGLVITTTCGNKTCTNPHHLRLCTQAGANRSGVGALLVPDEVTEIRRAKKDKGLNTARLLAERYGCSTTTIHDIWSGRSWGKPRNRAKGKAAESQAAVSDKEIQP